MARKKRVHASPMRPEIQGALWVAGLYGRLSVLDNGKVDGEPIESQIAIIEQYVAGHPELKIVERYIDNGYTGTNFDRPNWERMMADVKSGRINCIIVKDLSRLGRNYIETGRFLERICPKLGIRFISVNDNYDTAEIKSQHEFAASLKNIVNDYYAKDISLKSGSALKAKRQRGEYIGSYAPHGYLKDPSNKNHLIINPETAPVIQQIYQWRAEGLECSMSVVFHRRAAIGLNTGLLPITTKKAALFCGIAMHSPIFSATLSISDTWLKENVRQVWPAAYPSIAHRSLNGILPTIRMIRLLPRSFSIRYKKSTVRGQMPIMPIMEPAATSPRVITPIGKDWSVRTAGHK